MSTQGAATLSAEELDALAKAGGAGGLPQSQMGAEGGLSGKAPGKPMVKGKGADEEEEETDDDAEKSQREDDASIEALIKAVNNLEAAAAGVGGDVDRRATLAKSLENGTITSEEQQELIGLLGGAATQESLNKSDAGDSFVEDFANDSQLSEDHDVSGFLESLTTKIAKSLDSVRGELHKSSSNQQSFNRAMATGVKSIGDIVVRQQQLIKSLVAENGSLSGRVQQVEQTPLPRQAVSGTAQPLTKSQPGEAGGDGLSRDEILIGFHKLMEKSAPNDFKSKTGEDIASAGCTYESSGQITKSMLREIAEVLGKNINV
jgi:hypothetical protein